MQIKYRQRQKDGSHVGELFDEDNKLILRVHAHKMDIYEERQDDLDDPNVPFTLTTMFDGKLCWANSINLKDLKTFYYEIMFKLAHEKASEWRMFYASSESEDVFNEFLDLITIYQNQVGGITIFKKDEIDNYLVNSPRFLNRFVKNTNWNKCLIAIKNEFLEVYKTDWTIQGKQLK